MSNERYQAKNFFRLNGGLNTEVNELNFQDGFTKDEANYELLIDGSRRRRKGLASESGASTAKTVATHQAGEWNQTYLWENVGSDPDKQVMVYRKGEYLYFADADETVSDGWYTGNGSFIDMSPFYSDDGTDALVRPKPVTFSQGRGHLFVAGHDVKPFYVSFNPTTSVFTGNSIAIRIRDYTTIDDGTRVNTEPTDATIPADHRYNLLNRGWPQDRIDAYKTDQSKWPARNSIWYKGYKRVADESAANLVEQDGTETWDSVKMDAEVFGNSSAPVGSLFLDVYDTTTGFGNEDSGQVIAITGHTYAAGTHTLTITGHGRSASDEVLIEGNSFTYDAVEGGDTLEFQGSLDGVWTVASAPDVDTITITQTPVLYNSNFTSVDYGTADTSGEPLARSSGTDHGDAPKAVEFHNCLLYTSDAADEYNPV